MSVTDLETGPKDTIPGPQALSQASQMEVFDASGQCMSFGELFHAQKTIVIFIRHFFCGSCQAYVSQLSSVRKEALQGAGVHLIIVGCGEYHPIKNYCETTGFQGPVFADPSRNLYKLLDLTENLQRTPSDQPKKNYLANMGPVKNALGSIWRGPVKHPQYIGKQGNISQLGGEFIFGPGNQCTYASRMKHTEDHVDVADLMRVAGVAYP